VLEDSGVTRALRVHARFHEAFARIGSHPHIGHVRDDLIDDTLRVMSGFSYLIIDRPDTSPVQIIRVIHGARDLPKAFERET